MPHARANGIDLFYDTFGDPDASPLLLVMGLGAQMIQWDEGFCAALADAGHHVIRFDNRDVGMSTTLEHLGMPDVTAAFRAAARHEPVDAPYRLHDMAADAVGLLEALGIEAAHVVGASMGGMIAQAMAIEHPARVRSLTAIMSTTGHHSLPPARPEAMAALLMPVARDRAGNVERAVRISRIIGSPGFPLDEERLRLKAGHAFDRGFHPAGPARQLVAVTASGNRRRGLREVRVPTLVIHGTDDPLIPLECGRDIAACVPGAEMLEIAGMGHDMPRAVWPRLVDAIAALTARVG